MRRKPFYSFLVVVLLGIVTIFGIVQAQAQPVFRIGILDSENGNLSRGARLAIEEINQAGGVAGADGTIFRLEAVVQPVDNIDTAVANINQASVIAVIGPQSSEAALTGIQQLQSMNVPVFTAATDDTLIANDNSGRIFRARAQEVLQGRGLANYLVNDLAAQSVVTIQLDLASTASVIGFANAITGQGVTQHNTFLLDGNTTVEQIVSTVITSNPQVVVAYGPPESSAELYAALRGAAWTGVFAYNQASRPAFRGNFTPDQLRGILGITSWAYAATDANSTRFTNSFVRAFGAVPDAFAASSYDSINLLAVAIGQPGDLLSNLTQLDNFAGVQGVLTPAQLTRGEISTNVFVTQLGVFGAPQVVARYVNNQRVQIEDDPLFAIPTPTIEPSATPDGTVATILSPVQNVRSGPSVDFEVLGQVSEGEVIPVIGATTDFAWVVIQYRGQQGWLATYLLEVSGDRSRVPIIAPPATPTPGPTNTPPPVPDIVIISASPDRLEAGDDFSVDVTVRNNGTGNAGPFGVAASFEPGNVFAGVTLQGLQAQQQTVITLTGELGDSDTGPENIVIVADLNQQVDEGQAGEDNNDDFIFSYFVDAEIANSGTISIAPGGTLTLEGSGMVDLLWDGNDLLAQNGAVFERQNGINYNSVHYNYIDPGGISDTTLNVGSLPDAVVAVITAEGNRAVFRVNSVTAGGNLEIRFRVYE